MKRLAVVVCGAVLAVSTLAAQQPSELFHTQPPFALHSAFWPNLHQTLWAESTGLSPSLEGNLSKEERAAWGAAVAYYKEEIADLHPLFEMAPIRKALLAAIETAPGEGLMPAHRDALNNAAPIYRKHAWPSHDRANREWAADLMAKVASLSPTVPDRIAKLYGSPWFTSLVRVDVVRIASQEGAFTSIDPAPAHITISSANSTITGWMAAEVLFHEASHALARPILQDFGEEAKLQKKDIRDVWHVALFFMTGEIVRQALADSGIAFEPYIYRTGLFDRAWSRFKTPVEAHWKPYLSGEVSREQAIKNVVTAIK
jgi:hypothetical protein